MVYDKTIPYNAKIKAKSIEVYGNIIYSSTPLMGTVNA